MRSFFPLTKPYSVGAWLLVGLLAACATPAIQTDASYPAGWPKVVGALAECRSLEGTYSNKGTFVATAGKTHEVWLTSVLHFPFEESHSAAERDRQIKERQAMRRCERASLRLGSTVLRGLGPDSKRPELHVSSTHQVSSDPSAADESCGEFQEPPAGQREILSACRDNYLVIAPLGGGRNSVKSLNMASAIDGSLIIKVEDVWLTASHLGWARFQRLP